MRQQLLDPLSATQFQLRDAIRQRFAQDTATQTTDQVGIKSGLSRDQVGLRSGISAEQRIVLVQMADEHDITTMMQWVGRSNRSKFREAVLAPLLAMEHVEMTIPNKPNSSNQRYRLTEQGKALRDVVSE